MSVLEVVIRVSAQAVSRRARSAGPAVNNSPCRVVDRINKLVQLLLLVLRQRARLLVATREVDVHVGGHVGAVCVCDANARVLVQCVVRGWVWWGSGQGFGWRGSASVARLLTLGLCDGDDIRDSVEEREGAGAREQQAVVYST